MTKGDKVYFTRILPKTRVCELLELKIVSVNEDGTFSASEKVTRRTYLFTHKDIENIVFYDRNDAVEKINNASDKISKIEKLHTDDSI